jgi:membrane protein
MPRLLRIRFRRAGPWISAPDRLHELLPGRFGGFLSALAWLFCREATLRVFAMTFAFLLSVFPLIVLLMSLTAAAPLENLNETLLAALVQFFPVSQEWIVRNLSIYIEEIGIYQVISIVLLAWSGSVFFFALESALEAAYRVKSPRNFVGSQIRGTVLVLAMTILCLAAIIVLHLISLAADQLLSPVFSPELAFSLSYYAVVGVVVFCLLLCAFHWLPNRDQPLRNIIPDAIFATVLLLIADRVFRWLVPDMRLEEVYGPFYVSVTILLWGYTFGNIIAGSARLGANGFFYRSARIEHLPADQPVAELEKG